jgi:hypothetical protein
MMLISITITRVLVWSLAAIARKNRRRSDLFPPATILPVIPQPLGNGTDCPVGDSDQFVGLTL